MKSKTLLLLNYCQFIYAKNTLWSLNLLRISFDSFLGVSIPIFFENYSFYPYNFKCLHFNPKLHFFFMFQSLLVDIKVSFNRREKLWIFHISNIKNY